MTTQLQRTAFNSRRVVQAIRLLGQQGRSTEQALFVRALAESLDNDVDRGLAGSLDVKSAFFRVRVQVSQDDVHLATEELQPSREWGAWTKWLM